MRFSPILLGPVGVGLVLVQMLNLVDGRDVADMSEIIIMRIFYARPHHFLYGQYIAKNWLKFLSKYILNCIFTRWTKTNQFLVKMCDCMLPWGRIRNTYNNSDNDNDNDNVLNS